MRDFSKLSSFDDLVADLSAQGDPLLDQQAAERIADMASEALDTLNDRTTFVRGRAVIRLFLVSGLIGPLDNGAPVAGDFRWDIERAIGELHHAIAELSADHDANLVAHAHHDLARLYQESTATDQSGLRDRLALTHARKAAEIVDKARDRELWAKARSTYAGMLGANLSSSYEARDKGIAMLEETLAEIPDLVGSDTWCAATYSLGDAYIHRLNGEPKVNYAKSLHHLEKLAAVESEDQRPGRWAQTQFSLGKLWSLRADEGRALEHLENSLRAYERVAGSRATVHYDSLFRMLASEYHSAGDTARSDEFFQRAMDASDRESLGWARSAFQYADALADRDSAAALRLYRDSLEVYRRLDFAGYDTGIASRGLAKLLLRTYDAEGGTSKLDEAVRLLEQAKSPLWNNINIAYSLCVDLARLHARARKWKEAAEQYIAAIERHDLYYATFLLYQSKAEDIASTVGVRHEAAYALARAERSADAVKMLYSARMRLLGETLRWAESDLARLARLDHDLHQQFVSAAERVRALTALDRDRDRDDADLKVLADESQLASGRLADIITRIRQLDGFAGFLEPDTPDLHPPQPGETYVFLAATQYGTILMLVNGYPAAQDPVISVTYIDAVAKQDIWQALGGEEATPIYPSAESLQSALREIGPPFAAALSDKFPDRTTIVLVPCGPLGLLPLHLLEVSGDDGAPRLLVERNQVTYSLTGLSRDGERYTLSEASPAAGQALVVVDPAADLQFAKIEGSIVRRHFPDCEILAADATPAGVLSRLAGRKLVHFACHGSFDPARPYSSGLQLAGDILTIGSLLDASLTPLQSAGLVVLSSCESAMVDPVSPDEAIGLPAAFVGAGSSCAVGTLWPVDDLAATLFFHAFYDNMKAASYAVSKTTAARALRAAQLWLRQVTVREILAVDDVVNAEVRSLLRLFDDGDTPYSDERFWGAFVIVTR